VETKTCLRHCRHVSLYRTYLGHLAAGQDIRTDNKALPSTGESVPAHLATVSMPTRCHRARQLSGYLLPVRLCRSDRTTHRRPTRNRVITRQSGNSSRATTRILESINRLGRCHRRWLVFIVGGRSVGKRTATDDNWSFGHPPSVYNRRHSLTVTVTFSATRFRF